MPNLETLFEYLSEGDGVEVEQAHANIVNQYPVMVCSVLDYQECLYI